MGGDTEFLFGTLIKKGKAPVVNYAFNFSPLLGHHKTRESKGEYIPATTVSARGNLCSTWCIRPTSVHACRLRTLLRRIAMNTDHISACNKIIKSIKNNEDINLLHKKFVYSFFC